MDEMGLGNGLLPDSALTASSVRMPSGQYGPAMARLHSTSGWRPAHDTMQEYLTVIWHPLSKYLCKKCINIYV
jgi:hypothetical protein